MQFDLVFDRLKHVTVHAICAALLLYFVLPGVVGERGLFAMGRMRQQLAFSKSELDTLKTQRAAMEAQTKLLRPDNLDLDMLDERARATLGMNNPNEYVIYYGQQAR